MTVSWGGKVYLIGFMGAGKTAVGLRLAEQMGVQFVDLDQRVEAEAGLAIAEIFARDGEEGFRRLETAALGSVAAQEGELVVATGGGTATRSANLELMESTGTSVWLDPPFDVILNRLEPALRQERPLFESRDQARQLYEDRRLAYSAATLRIDVPPSEEPGETAERVLRNLSNAKPVNPWPKGNR